MTNKEKELLRLIQDASVYLYPAVPRGSAIGHWIKIMKRIGKTLNWEKCKCENGCNECHFTGFKFSMTNF
jgi:hypothetical protein